MPDPGKQPGDQLKKPPVRPPPEPQTYFEDPGPRKTTRSDDREADMR